MNQEKTGKFIAERRREKNLTQLQLAEMLSITDRAVSKWERGVSMPDASIMLELCSILGITVNELLSGEKISGEDYSAELERNLLEMIREKEKSDKRLLTMEIVIGVLSAIVLFVPIIFASYFQMEDWQRIVLMLSGVVPALVGFFFALKIEQLAGYYECRECHHRYVPGFKEVGLAMHMGRKRYMRCPKCGKKSWQIKVISRNRDDGDGAKDE